MQASPDQQISLTDPDARSMATSGRGSDVVGYNVQVAVDTEHHLIVTHEVTKSGSDRTQLANMGKQAKDVLQAKKLEAVADRGYFNSPEILACERAGITVTLPKPMTSGAKSEGRFGMALGWVHARTFSRNAKGNGGALEGLQALSAYQPSNPDRATNFAAVKGLPRSAFLIKYRLSP